MYSTAMAGKGMSIIKVAKKYRGTKTDAFVTTQHNKPKQPQSIICVAGCCSERFALGKNKRNINEAIQSTDIVPPIKG